MKFTPAQLDILEIRLNRCVDDVQPGSRVPGFTHTALDLLADLRTVVEERDNAVEERKVARKQAGEYLDKLGEVELGYESLSRYTVAGDLAITLNGYQQLARATAIYPGKGFALGLAYSTLGLTGEAGEVAEKVKKLLRDAAGVLDDARRDAIKKELGDVLWYLASVAAEIGVQLDEVARDNLKKLSARKERGTLQGEGDNR
jgi:NTP pyrophosphatase (non-canonical NTP hydrolase)